MHHIQKGSRYVRLSKVFHSASNVVELPTSDAIKIKLNTVVFYYYLWFDFASDFTSRAKRNLQYSKHNWLWILIPYLKFRINTKECFYSQNEIKVLHTHVNKLVLYWWQKTVSHTGINKLLGRLGKFQLISWAP